MSEQVFTSQQEGQCPECGAEDEDLCFSETTLRWYCEDCWNRDKERYRIK
jgi:hypothetical protein